MRHPARLLESIGLLRIAAALRRWRWYFAALLPALRPRHAGRLTALWMREPLARRAYRVLSEQDLLATKKSDTVFVFGSGRSLVDIADEDWRRIAEFDTVGFSHFHRQGWIRVDYHLVAEVASTKQTAVSIANNPLYTETTFGVMRGWIAEASNDMVANHLLPPGARIFRWRRISRGRSGPPSRYLRDGLVHGMGTIQDVVNFALVMGWRRIVIAGVDLYNKEYFWLPAGTTHEYEAPGMAATSRWIQADTIVDALGRWAALATRDGVTVEVYDSRSLLSRTLPVFEW